MIFSYCSANDAEAQAKNGHVAKVEAGLEQAVHPTYKQNGVKQLLIDVDMNMGDTIPSLTKDGRHLTNDSIHILSVWI